MLNITFKEIMNWLEFAGFLARNDETESGYPRMPTEEGKRIGISVSKRYSRVSGGYSQEYTVVLYDKNAQEFIIDNLDAILCVNRSERT